MPLLAAPAQLNRSPPVPDHAKVGKDRESCLDIAFHDRLSTRRDRFDHRLNKRLVLILGNQRVRVLRGHGAGDGGRGYGSGTG